MQMNTPLQAKYYTEPSWYDQDKENIFYRSWQCVCHISEVAEKGAYATLQIADENIFVIRDDDSVLRAFYNICRHRGHPLVEGFGRARRRLVCPYHAWSYGRDGSLKNVPGQGENDVLSCVQADLKPVALEEYSGFVFVNLDPDAAPLKEQISGFEDIFRTYHPDPSKLTFICETSIEHDCNWKISVENYNECYHCPTVHGSSLAKGVLSMKGYTTVPQGRMIWHEGKAQTQNEKQYEYDVTKSPRAGDYGAYWTWPNVSFCFYPGGYFTIRQWLPVSWRKTIYRYRWFSDGTILAEDVRALMEKHKSTTGAEDEAVVSSIQSGMESRSFEPGPYIMGDGLGAMSEVGLRHFHNLYRETLEPNDAAE